MKSEAFPLVGAVKDKIAQRQMHVDSYSEASVEEREEIQEQFQEAYITEHAEGCCPDAWIGDDLMGAIIDKFRYVLETVEEEAISQTNIPHHHLITVVEPSWQNSTYAAILHDAWNVTGKKALCWFESTKAWRFCWDTESEMERALQSMVSEVVEVIRKVRAVEPSAATVQSAS
jgi:hypothetical protein